MGRGPLPDPKKRRRNAPTIPTTDLPATGREGDPPEIPEAYNLGLAGTEWWAWAWHLPQACAWDDGALYVAARRARLEDDLAALENADTLIDVVDDLAATAAESDNALDLKSRLTALGETVAKLKSLAGGSTSLMKEMRELDNRLGLNPKALSDLRWKIVDSDGAVDGKDVPAPAKRSSTDRRARLSVVA